MDISFVLRKFKKSIAGFTILALLASFVSFAGIASAFDDTSGHWAGDYIDELVSQGVVSGYDDDTFGPDDSLTRAQLAKIAVLAFLGEDAIETGDAVFVDVLSSHWGYDYITTAYNYGIVSGYTDADGEATGYYGPEDIVTRDAAAKILVGAAGLTMYTPESATFTDVATSAWSYEYVETAYFYSVLDGYGGGLYGPADAVTRGQISKMTVNAQNPVERTEDTGGDDDDTTTGEGATLEVELSSDTPAGDTVPDKATSVEIATWDFTADGADLELDMVQIHQYAITTLATDHNVYLYNGAERLTSGTSINSTTGLAKFNNLNITIEEGETISLTVRLDVGNGTTVKEVGVELVDVDAVDAGEADVDGDFPLQGEKFDIATEEAGTITIEKNGTITNPKVGEDDVTIAKFKLAAADEGADLAEIGLYLTGTVTTSDVVNFELYVTGTDDPIATVEAVDSNDVVRFVLDEVYEIAKGDSRIFYVTADFNTGRTSDDVKLYLDEDTDLVAYGDKYGYGMSVTKTNYDGTAANCSVSSSTKCSYSALEGGDITVSSSGPAASDMGIDADDAVLMNFSITSVAETTFKNFGISLNASEAEATEGLVNGTAANFTDIKITDVDSGNEIWSAVDVDVFTITSLGGSTAIDETTNGDDAQSYHLFTDDLEMEAGEELNLALTTDVANTTTLDGMTLVATLELGTSYPELRDSNNKVLKNSTTLVPYSAVTAKTMTVETPSLTMALASTPSSRTYVKGTTDVQFTGLVFTCGTATDCVVTDVTLTGYLHETGGTPTSALATAMQTYVNQVWFEDADGEMIGSAASITATGTAVFDNEIDWTIDAGASETLYIVGDMTSNCYSASSAESIGFGLNAATDVTVSDSDGNTITPTGTPNSTPTYYATTASGGPLTITVADDTPNEDIIIAGATGVEVSKFKFSTEGASDTDPTEDMTVQQLTITNRQSAATTAAIGDYDDNVTQVEIEYSDSNGDTVSKTASLVGGVATFTAMDFLIEAGSYEYLTVSADLNTTSSGADAGTYVDLNLGFSNFKAAAASSGETYTASYIDATYAAASDLDFGSITWTDDFHDVNLAVATIAALGSAQTITVDDEGALDPENLPVGTLLCVSEDLKCSGEAVYVVTSWTDGTVWTDGVAGDTVTTLVLDNAVTALANNNNLVYALPGTGYLTGSEYMYVYESVPTLTLSTTSPAAGVRSVSPTDTAFVFDITASEYGEVKFRAGVAEAGAVMLDGVGDPCTISSAVATAALQVDGAGEQCLFDAATGDGDTMSIALATTTSDISQYARVNFWMKWNDASDASDALFTDLRVGTGLLATTLDTPGQAGLTAAECGASAATITDNVWYNCDTILPVAATIADIYFHLEIADSTRIVDTDIIHLDAVKFYNEKITVDMATDTGKTAAYTANTSNVGGPVAATLTKDGDTYATGYFSTYTQGATATASAYVTFIPTTAITVSAGADGTETLKLVTNTQDLLADVAGVDDPTTFSIDYGSASDLTVTAGDVYWYETNATVTWLGHQADTKLSGNTVKY